jgi:hydroxyethylthiazole kinase
MASFREFSRAGESWNVEAWKSLCKVREVAPLVQCITNFVSMDIMANTLLAAGASPAMVHAVEEISEFTALANALCINIGTLSPEWIFSMKAAALRANELGKPWVLDPVGVGASRFRTERCLELITLRPAVIRGNASEIMAVVGAASSPPKVWNHPSPPSPSFPVPLVFFRGSAFIGICLFYEHLHCCHLRKE